MHEIEEFPSEFLFHRNPFDTIFVYVGGSSSSSPFGGGIELRNNPCKSWCEHKKLVVSLLDSILLLFS